MKKQSLVFLLVFACTIMHSQTVDSVLIIRDDLIKIEEPNKKRANQVNNYRYFLSPSSSVLKKGQVVYDNQEILMNTLRIGLNNHLMLSIGASPHAGVGIPFSHGIKCSHNLTKRINTSIGYNSIFVVSVMKPHETVHETTLFLNTSYQHSKGAFTVGFISKTKTYDVDKLWDYRSQLVKHIIDWSNHSAFFVVAGDYKLSNNVSLVAENWFAKSEHYGLFATTKHVNLTPVGLRLFNFRSSLDVGLIGVYMTYSRGFSLNIFGTTGDGSIPEPDFIPVPYIGYSYKF